jgi:hypothetical protein
MNRIVLGLLRRCAIEPLAVEAQPTGAASEDFDIASAENVEGESDPEDEPTVSENVELGHDTGELYGVRTPHAADTNLAAREDQDLFEARGVARPGWRRSRSTPRRWGQRRKRKS